MKHCWSRKSNFAFSAPFVAFNARKKVASTFYVLGTSFNSWHIILVSVREGILHGFLELRREGNVRSLVSSCFSAFSCIEVILTCFSLDHFPRFGDLDPLSKRLVRPLFHSGR